MAIASKYRHKCQVSTIIVLLITLCSRCYPSRSTDSILNLSRGYCWRTRRWIFIGSGLRYTLRYTRARAWIRAMKNSLSSFARFNMLQHLHPKECLFIGHQSAVLEIRDILFFLTFDIYQATVAIHRTFGDTFVQIIVSGKVYKCHVLV